MAPSALRPVWCRVAAVLAVLLALAGCGNDDDGVSGATPTATPSATTTPAPSPAATPVDEDALVFGAPGPISGEEGRGSFRFGVATAATQIEDQNPHTDWYLWTAPEPDGLGHDTFVGDAVRGFSKALDDVELIAALNLDIYRFSVEWSRVEPVRDVVDEAALLHYDGLIDALVAEGITPMITLHHFSSPVWVDDPRDPACDGGPTDENLCGWDHASGADEIIAELAEHARLLGERYGDRVDDWATLNEPVNYLLASYGVAVFPPGKALLLAQFDRLVDVFRNYVRAHVAIYDALKAADTIDADGDGVAAHVGFTLNTVEWQPSRDNAPSSDPEDIAAAERVRYVYHYLFPDSVLFGGFDADLDGNREEEHPDWAGKLDWLGVQYYSRQGVSSMPQIIPVLDLMVCFGEFDFGSCVPPADATHFVPAMGYEYYEPGIFNILSDLSARWPSLPMTVTESGLATENGVRRAEHIVRSLEQIHQALENGVDVRGYYHWSLMDNFEWAEGFVPRFGLYRVDFATYERTPTEGADILAEIAATRRVSGAMREMYGGLGPMSAEFP